LKKIDIMEMKNNKLIVVLGMHRSGTSVITRGLQVMGVGLGDRMMLPIEGDNPKGFWEDIDLNALNIEMLNTINSDWCHVASIEPIDVEILCKLGYLLRAVELLRQKVGSAPVFGFKDPRVAKLLPFWKEIFSHCQFDVSYLLVIRHPLSVVKSLAKRNGIEAEHSYLLWLGHVITSLTGTAGDKRVLVDYDRLMQSPDRELMRVAKCTGLKIDPVELQSYKSEFLDQGLRHTVYGLNDLLLDDPCPPIVREVYAALLDVASEKTKFDDLELQNKVLRWSDEFERLGAPLLLIDKLLTQKVSAGQALAECDGQLVSLNLSLSERDALIAELKEERARLLTVTQSNSWKITNLTDEVVARGEWALQIDRELQEERSRFLKITQSNSWRVTWPLREVRRWISTPRHQTKRYLKVSLRTAKRVYQRLPLSYKTKASHRNALSKYFPTVLLASGSPSETIPLNLPTDPVNFARTIKIPTTENPLVSVVIPIYGKIDYTLRCLASISANPPQASFEVIIVDDCSPDNSTEVLANIQSIILIHNEQNQGFIRSCNTGASAAQGEYLYFLNNDTVVTPGWMDELVRTFHEFPGTGLAGSKLTYPDGRLQEAGGIIWQDGSAWNFGRLQDPLLPVYNYAREVDYCSGASIMVPKELFDELGGFDEHYLPAYCEDADLALKVREKGYRVIYQPMSIVIHYEGITSGTDIKQGTKAYQIENTKKLYHRWKEHLQNHQLAGIDVDSAKDRRATRRVLVIDSCTPTPDQDSGSIDTYNFMLLLREMDFQVTFIPEDNFLFLTKYTTGLQRVGIEVLYAPYVNNVERHLIESNNRYDLAFLIRPLVAERYMIAIRKLCPKAKVLFHTVDLHFLRMMREAVLNGDDGQKEAAEKMKVRELALLSAADVATVVSTQELILLSEYQLKEKVKLLPYSRHVSEGKRPGFDDRKDIVFVGSYQHTPNVDAVMYFVGEIMPLLRHRLPGLCFYVVGTNPPEQIKALACEDIIITGFIEDLTPLLNKIRVSVAPLRYGAGIKGKIGSAMAIGLPVVATPLAIEGMSLTDGENILVAENPTQFANTIGRLYQEETLWNKISHNGLEFAKNAWGAKAAWKALSEILADISLTTTRRKYPLSLYIESADIANKPFHQQTHQLTPIASVQNREEYKLALESDSLKQIKYIEETLVDSSSTKTFAVEGFCVPCSKQVRFLVDMESGGQLRDNSWLPNWRERLECPLCRMNNRQRLIATLIKRELEVQHTKCVYFMEQVTPIYRWATTTYKNHNIVGSEYLGHQYESGTTIKGTRHEDVESLSFTNDEFDLIVSNDVFEHVPNPATAFAECCRVLKTGGVLLATIPFHSQNDLSITRTNIVDGELFHNLPPSYHGNPVSADGSLVFTDFGWDVLEEMQVAGFSDVSLEIYASAELGHLGGGQIVFKLLK
jgi:GT2 family glycosyltransferase